MQAIVETLFDAAYLSTVITIGILMIRRSKGNVQYTLFGWMAVVLGAGDSFHLIPRALALCEQAHLWPEPLRSIGVRALDLQPACAPHQMDLFEDAERRARARRLDITLDNLRARYGKTCVLRGRACFDPALGLVQREEHAFLRK